MKKYCRFFLLCVALSNIWFCYSCSGTLLHDSRSYSALVYLSLCCALCWVCVCVCALHLPMLFCRYKSMPANFIRVFFPVSFVRFIRSFIRLAARSHSFANSRSLSLSLSLCFARAPSLSSTFVCFLRVLLVSYRGGSGGGLLLFAIDCPIYTIHTRALARHSHFYVKHFLCSMSSLLSIELNRWVDFKWIGRADSSFLLKLFFFQTFLCVCVHFGYRYFNFSVSFCDFVEKKKEIAIPVHDYCLCECADFQTSEYKSYNYSLAR